MTTNAIPLPKRTRSLFTVGACYVLVVVGLLMTTLGPIVPFLMGHFDLSPSAVGVIFSTRGIGYLFSVVLGGVLTDYYGRKRAVISGALLAGLSLLIAAVSDSWLAVVSLAVVTGVGQGLLDGVANVIMTDMHPHNPGQALNFLHLWWGVGAFAGPLISGFFLAAGGNWQAVLAFVGVAALVLGALFAPFVYPVREGQKETGTRSAAFSVFKGFASSPLFVTVTVIVFLYNGAAGAIIGWLSTYLGTLFQFSPMTASLTLSLYSGGILVGRAFMGVFVERMGYGLALLICSFGSFLSLVLATASPIGLLSAAGFVLTGLCFSGLFPTAMAVGRTLFPEVMGAVSGALVGSGALGSMVVPPLVGLVAGVTNIRVAMGTSVVLGAFLGLAGVKAYIALRPKRATV